MAITSKELNPDDLATRGQRLTHLGPGEEREVTDWNLVGGDPAPGDTGAIQAGAKTVTDVAEAIELASEQLSKIVRGTRDAHWRGMAADQMREHLKGLKGDLRPVAESFRSLGSIMSRYASDLGEIQLEAARALNRASLAKREVDASEGGLADARSLLRSQQAQLNRASVRENSHRLTSATQDLIDPAGSVSRARESLQLANATARARSLVSDTNVEIARIELRLQRAQESFESEVKFVGSLRDRYDDVSNAAAGRVDGSLADSLKNLSTWEKFKNSWDGLVDGFWNGDFLERLRNSLSTIIKVVAVAVLVVGLVVLIVGAPWAGVLLLTLTKVALALAVAKAVTTAAILTRAAHGGKSTDLTMGDLAIDVAEVGLAAYGVHSAGTSVVKSLSRRATVRSATGWTEEMLKRPTRLDKIYTVLNEHRMYAYHGAKTLAKPVATETARYTVDEAAKYVATEKGKGVLKEWIDDGSKIGVDSVAQVSPWWNDPTACKAVSIGPLRLARISAAEERPSSQPVGAHSGGGGGAW